MLDKYIDYRVDKLIEDYEVNRITLINLKTQLEEADGWASGERGERVQSSPNGDGMDKLLIRRNQIQGTIDEYEKMFEVYDRAWNALNEQERFVLMQFFQRNQSKQMACWQIKEKYFIQEAKIYNIRREALDRMKQLIWGQ